MALTTYEIENGLLHNGFRNVYGRTLERRKKSAVIDIPMGGDVFEIPIFAVKELNIFIHAENQDIELYDVSAITMQIDTCGKVGNYKTVERNMQDILFSEPWYDAHMFPIYDGSNIVNRYYVKTGTIFNSNMQPIAMFTWKILKESNTTYRFLKPLLRIDRSIWISPDDAVKKFITRKLTQVTLEAYVMRHYNLESHNVELIIGDIPFKTRMVSAPSVSTTRDNLISTVLNHTDQLMQAV